jgi:hypothetical protein
MDFLSQGAGQARRKWLDEKTAGLMYFVPPELRPYLDAAASMTPAAAYGDSVAASRRMLDKGATAYDRGKAAGDMAASVLGIVAPMAMAGQAGAPLAQAVEEGLLNYSAGPRNALADFGASEDGAMRVPYIGGNLRERYKTGLDYASGGKDVARIKITPQRVAKAKEYYARPYNPEWFASEDDFAAFTEAMSRPTNSMAGARALAEEAVRNGEKVRFRMPDGPRGSIYVRVGDKGTFRFSDHAQPNESGKVVGGYSTSMGRRHHPATASVDPHSGTSLDDVMAMIRKKDGPAAPPRPTQRPDGTWGW